MTPSIPPGVMILCLLAVGVVVDFVDGGGGVAVDDGDGAVRVARELPSDEEAVVSTLRCFAFASGASGMCSCPVGVLAGPMVAALA